MKPKRTQAMEQLIDTVRENFPFDEADANICTGQCNTCAMKLLEYLDTELDTWECKLKQGDTPSFGDINKMAKTSQKIHKVLAKNNLVD
jgi:hypothetical protein